MKYNSTDIILCFPGIGRTRFKELGSNGSFTIDVGAEATADQILELKKSQQYRYILAPLTQKLVEDLWTSWVTPFIIVAPWYYDKEDRIKLWMKAGADAKTLAVRAQAWKDLEVYTLDDPTPKELVLIHLDPDEWLGHLLAQTPIDASGE